MNTRISRVNTKFTDHPTDPAQLIAVGVGESMDFWNFQLKKSCDVIDWCHIFSHFSRTGKFRLVIRRNGSMFSADPKRVPDLQKTIHWQASKNTLLAIPFSFLKTGTKFSKFARVKKWQHWLILLIVDPRSNIQSKKSCSLKINVSRIFCLNKNRKITNRWQTNKKTKIG